VRLGAFHIFTPLLLKPAATELRLLLWALQLKKAGTLELASLPVPPGQGLTSTIFDRTTPRGFYGVCGYRICGSRVVRIDMLERLADMIRERVFWRPRFPEEPRPLGSVEGGGFTIVADMMSLVGCSGEEFQAILRSLDFRMQKRKVKRPAAEPAPAAPADAAEPAPADAAAGEIAATPVETPPEVEAAIIAEAPAAVAEPAEEPVAEVPAAEPVAELATTVSGEVALVASQGEAEPAPQTSETAAGEAAPGDPAADEIELEIWWPKDTGPFRRDKPKPEARSQHRHKRQRPEPKAGEEAGKPAEAGKPPHKHKPGKPHRPPRPERKPEKPIDPDSPFAVLGVLKAQLANKS